MQNVLYRLSENPGSIRWTGRKRGADTKVVLTELNAITPDEWNELLAAKVIAEAE
jgi:crotonobetainyl-CoA:carnitine CoA-transferase CaiB-like acyl-CoA transferase